MNDFLISASILSADFSNLAGQVSEIERAGVDWIHVDVMDGHFVPNITMGPFIVKTLRALTNLPLEAHLMIDNPEKFIEPFRLAGADRINVHIERQNHLLNTLQKIRQLGAMPGIVINPETPTDSLIPFLGYVDLILVMSVHPGFAGQQFIRQSIDRIRSVRNLIEQSGRDIHLEVDGGITPQNISQVIEAGVDVVVAATSIFQHKDGINAGVKSLRNVDLNEKSR